MRLCPGDDANFRFISFFPETKDWRGPHCHKFSTIIRRKSRPFFPTDKYWGCALARFVLVCAFSHFMGKLKK
jgi:hypothetical protein